MSIAGRAAFTRLKLYPARPKLTGEALRFGYPRYVFRVEAAPPLQVGSLKKPARPLGRLLRVDHAPALR
jgi:hypothetical protein